MTHCSNEKIDLVKMFREDIDELMPMLTMAFESSIREGLGRLENELMPSDIEIKEMPFSENTDSYKILLDGKVSGGAIIKLNLVERRNKLELLFISPLQHSKGAGTKVWQLIEELYPDIEVWETVTPEFASKNIHFYVNKCGFHIVEYFNKWHKDPNQPDIAHDKYPAYRFEKQMKK